VVPHLAAVVAKDPHPLREIGGVGGHHPPVAVAPEVLAGEEAESAHQPDGPGHPAADVGAEGLRAVLDDEKPVLPADGADRLHVRGLAEEVDRKDGAGLRRYGRPDLRRIDVEGLRVDVHEDRRRADVADRLRGGDEGERGRDDLVAGPYPRGQEGEVQRVRAGGHGDGVLRAEEFRRLALEGLHVGPEDELGLLQRIEEARRDLLPETVELDLQVNHGDHEGTFLNC